MFTLQCVRNRMSSIVQTLLYVLPLSKLLWKEYLIVSFYFIIMELQHIFLHPAILSSHRHHTSQIRVIHPHGRQEPANLHTVYPKKYAHGFVMLCFVVVMQSFIMNSCEVFIHIHQGCFAGTGAIVRLPQCQWSKPDGYGKISQCITITKHSKAKTVCIFLGLYCNQQHWCSWWGQGISRHNSTCYCSVIFWVCY